MSKEQQNKKKQWTLQKLREHIRNELIFDLERYSDVFPVFDFADAIARLIDGFNHMTSPDKIMRAADAAEASYMMMADTEVRATVASLVGGKDKVEQLLKHENARQIIPRLMERVGGCVPGKDVTGVDVSDILREEGFE